MSELGKELSALPAQAELARRQTATPPSGWEPGVAWDGTKGTLTTEPLTEAPKDWAELLEVWGLDPAIHEVIEPVGFRAWDGAVKLGDGTTGKQRMYYYRANIRLRRGTGSADVEELLDLVRNYKPCPSSTPHTGELAFIVCLNDWQIGKSDGDGTDGTIIRIMNAIDAVEHRINELRRAGRGLSTLYVMGLGDMIENCGDHYAQQAFRAELSMTEQLRVTRRLIIEALMRWSSMFDKVVVAAVQGNHGEIRKDGKSFTDFADNMDTDVFVCAHEVLMHNPSFEHVSFVFPQGQELTLTLDCAGTRVGLVHGHQFSNVNKVTDWWAKQAHGRQPIGDADVLLTGHFHHLRLMQDVKTWIQAPALDGGSDWWRHRSGNDAPPGVLTLVVGGGSWYDLAVL